MLFGRKCKSIFNEFINYKKAKWDCKTVVRDWRQSEVVSFIAIDKQINKVSKKRVDKAIDKQMDKVVR